MRKVEILPRVYYLEEDLDLENLSEIERFSVSDYVILNNQLIKGAWKLEKIIDKLLGV